jgi:cyanophycinase
MSKRLLLALCSTLLLSAAQPPQGTLVIVGGGGMPQEIMDAFVAACGGKGGRVGIVPTSTSDPDGALKEWREDLDKAGLTMVPLDVRERAQASDPALLAAAATCTGFWFSGGDQNRVGDKIVGTPLQRVITDRYRAGAGVGGTSAGAAIMSQIMIMGEDRHGKETLHELGPGAYLTREGMGFLPAHCIVDQHFLRRNRQNRLFSVLMEHPDHLGLGIDEATALVVKDGRGRVLGRSAVMVFDPDGMAVAADGTFRNLRISLLYRGQDVDLTPRKARP